ncbi:MAG: hypothetical protein CME06_12130 [Gemmatimonadetes bacterium]|nr:hypothetical protein [Gemmatimonadota bacterium]
MLAVSYPGLFALALGPAAPSAAGVLFRDQTIFLRFSVIGDSDGATVRKADALLARLAPDTGVDGPQELAQDESAQIRLECDQRPEVEGEDPSRPRTGALRARRSAFGSRVVIIRSSVRSW